MKTYVTFYEKFYPSGDSRVWTGPYIYAKSQADLDYMLKRLSKFFPKLEVAGVLVDSRNSMEMNKSAFN